MLDSAGTAVASVAMKYQGSYGCPSSMTAMAAVNLN